MLTKTTLVLFCSLSGLTAELAAQCGAGGIHNPSAGASNTSTGTVVWGGTENMLSSNNTHSVATAAALGDNTQYLTATGFGFAVPATAVICGIQVEIEKHATGLLNVVTDHSVKIIKAGVVTGSEHALGALWGSTDAYSTYGGAANLWGTTWTPADINAGNFGVAISVHLGGIVVLPTAHIDHIRITIFYDNILPIDLLRFDAQCAGETVALSWGVVSETNNDYFTIERATGSAAYQPIATIDGAGNSNQFKAYSFTDTDPLPGVSYYRLKQTDFNGDYEYFNAVAVNCTPPQAVLVHPNPATDHITVRFAYLENEQYTLTLCNTQGQTVHTAENVTGSLISIDRQQLGRGVYFLRLRSNKEVLTTEKVILE